MYLLLAFVFAALAAVFYAFTVAEVRAAGKREAKETKETAPPSTWNPVAVFGGYYRVRRTEGAIGWLPALTLASIAGAVYTLLRALNLV
ncbi:hypothetical protein ACFLT7_03695 [candidate division KSB1 bacterium]